MLNAKRLIVALTNRGLDLGNVVYGVMFSYTVWCTRTLYSADVVNRFVYGITGKCWNWPYLHQLADFGSRSFFDCIMCIMCDHSPPNPKPPIPYLNAKHLMLYLINCHLLETWHSGGFCGARCVLLWQGKVHF
jgi:hypothetical protein